MEVVCLSRRHIFHIFPRFPISDPPIRLHQPLTVSNPGVSAQVYTQRLAVNLGNINMLLTTSTGVPARSEYR
jgi:hypothetical protein